MEMKAQNGMRGAMKMRMRYEVARDSTVHLESLKMQLRIEKLENCNEMS